MTNIRKQICSICMSVLFLILFFPQLETHAEVLAQVQTKVQVQEENVSVKKITLSKTSDTLNIGDSYTLKATLYPENANNKQLLWHSENPEIVKVSQQGRVTAIKPGKATIWVETIEGEATAKCVISVKKPTLSEKEISLYETESKALYVLGGYGKITYKSDNPTIAKVTADGKVTAVKSGKTTIVVTRSGVTMKCVVTVKKIKLNTTQVSLYAGNRKQLDIIGTKKQAKYSSSNTQVATVSNSGMIKAKKAGSATITVQVAGKKLNCKVTIKKSDLHLNAYTRTVKTKGVQRILVSFNSADRNQIVVQTGAGQVVKASYRKLKSTSGEIVFLPLKAGTTKITVWSKRNPSDKKTVTIKVSKGAISQKPKLSFELSERTKKKTSVGTMKITNQGKYPVKLFRDAYSYDFDTSYYDRTMKLISNKTGKVIRSKEISPGKSSDVIYEIQGKATWYDAKTKYEFEIEYDGLRYGVIASAYFGVQIKLIMK